MLLGVKAGWHSRRPFNPVSERHSLQIAMTIVAPLMVCTNVVFGVASRAPADERATMGATVHPCGKTVVLCARDHHRSITDERALKVAATRDLGFHGDEAPDRSAENPLLFQLIDFRRAIDLEGNARTVRTGEIDRLRSLRSGGCWSRYFIHIALPHALYCSGI
jgi:hypothetical protein